MTKQSPTRSKSLASSDSARRLTRSLISVSRLCCGEHGVAVREELYLAAHRRRH